MRTAIVTVHGTGEGRAARVEPAVTPWWRDDSEFCRELKDAIGGDADIVPFVWSGRNSETDRVFAARDLVRLMSGETSPLAGYDAIHFVSHSHGGNVVLKALRVALSRSELASRIGSWTTVATPFFRDRLSRTPLQRYGLYGLAGLSLFIAALVMAYTVLLFGGMAAMIAMMGPDEFHAAMCGDASSPGMVAAEFCATAFHSGRVAAGDLLIYVAAAAPAGVVSYVLSRILLARSVKVQMFGRRRAAINASRTFLASRFANVYHPADEAILFLQQVDRFSAEMVPRARVAAMVRTGMLGTLLGVLVAAAILLAALWASIDFDALMSADSIVAMETLRMARPEAFHLRHFVNALLGNLTALAVAVPFIGVAVYGLYFISVRLVVEPLIHRLLNDVVRSSIRNAAYGNDLVGLRVLATGPHIPDDRLPRAAPLPAMLQAALEAHVTAHAQETLATVRARLVAGVEGGAGGDMASAVMEELSWNELAHTAYFNAPAVREHVIAEVLRASGLPASAR
ncbi:MAG: hypothetical protein GC152_03390 [Alphaproteobacteria bacterium]|nr:hypothetical protein [Alphaproteobacteria bacterium]